MRYLIALFFSVLLGASIVLACATTSPVVQKEEPVFPLAYQGDIQHYPLYHDMKLLCMLDALNNVVNCIGVDEVRDSITKREAAKNRI